MSERPEGFPRRTLLGGALAGLGAGAVVGWSEEALAVPAAVPAGENERVTVTVEEGTNVAVAASPDGTIMMDLQGALFTIPPAGGKASRVGDDFLEPFWPAWSPDGSRIAIQSFKDGMFHIWTLAPDGGSLRQLTFGHYDDQYPAWSPDGRSIAFASAREDTNNIWTVDVPSGELTRVTTAGGESQPTWSPDGSRIAYVRDNAIEAIEVETGTVEQWVPSRRAPLDAPSWAPDGERVAFTRRGQNGRRLVVAGPNGTETRVGDLNNVYPFPPRWLSENELLYAGNGKIVISGLAAGTTRTVPFSATFRLSRPTYQRKSYDFDSRDPHQVKGIVGPALSPDGRSVAFKALNNLWLLPIGGQPRKLTDDTFYESAPAWSPDGRRIAYASDEAGTEDLYVMTVRSGRKRGVAKQAGAQVAPAWAPDGRRLAFQDQRGQTFVLDLDSGETRRVTDPLRAPGRPSWSADGRTIALAVSADSRNQIMLVDVATGDTRTVEPAPWRSISTRGDDGPVWSPDGRWLAFTMESTLWVMPVQADGTPTGDARQITEGVSDAPTWSGDSKSLLYLENGKLRLVARDGSRSSEVPLRLRWRRAQPRGRTVIHVGRLWDGRSPTVRRDVDVTVEGNRISSVRPHEAGHGRGENDRFVDAADLTLVPGMVDMHNHQELRSSFYGDRQGRLWLSFGVTSTRSTGDPAYRAIEDREALASGARMGPRFFATGEMLEGSRLGWDFARPVMNEEQLDLELSRARELGYDLIKTYSRFPFAWQAEVTRRAHEFGIPTTSHYLYPGVAHGVDMKEHLAGPTRWGFGFSRSSAGGSVYEDVVQLLAKAPLPFTTTLFSSSALLADDPGIVDDPRVRALYPTWELETLRDELACAQGRGPCGPLSGNRERARAQVAIIRRILAAGGVPVAGTDSPLDNVAVSFHLNLRAMATFGMKPFEVLQAATIVPARQLAIEDDLGTVEPGKLADLVLVDGDPSTNIADLAGVRKVMKNGELHTVEELLGPFG